jgi:hypothetical protein
MPDAARPADLCALGLGAAEDAAYELLLSHPGLPLSALEEHWDRPEDLAVALAGLAARRLAERLPGDPLRYLAVRPAAVLDGQLTDLEQQLRLAREHVAELTMSYHTYRSAAGLQPGTVVEVVTGHIAITRRVEEIRVGILEELRYMELAPHATAMDTAFRFLPPGVVRRAIYDRAALDRFRWPASTGDCPASTGEHPNARVLPRVPLRLYLADRRLAVVPFRHAPSEASSGQASSGEAKAAVMIVYPSALLDALSDLFETVWSRALPLLGEGGKPDPGSDQPVLDERLIALLLAGFTDTASARHLGVSQRTVQRRVAALLAELSMATRFQAGAQLALRDAAASPAATPPPNSARPTLT